LNKDKSMEDKQKEADELVASYVKENDNLKTGRKQSMNRLGSWKNVKRLEKENEPKPG